MYKVVKGPVHPDCCSHGEDSYLFTLNILTGQLGDGLCWNKVDVYLHVCNVWKKQSVCMRFGEDGDYYSPIGLRDFLTSADNGMDVYRAVADEMEKRGYFTYERKCNEK